MEVKLTKVKILIDLYKQFKGRNLDGEFTLQKLVNRSMDLYVRDDKFRKKIEKYDALKPSGSRL